MGIKKESEETFQAAVIKTAWLLGWDHYHTLDSRGSDSNFPDLVLWRRKPADLIRFKVKMMVAECKRLGEEPTPGQRFMLQVFETAGIPAYWWTPNDWDEINSALTDKELAI